MTDAPRISKNEVRRALAQLGANTEDAGAQDGMESALSAFLAARVPERKDTSMFGQFVGTPEAAAAHTWNACIDQVMKGRGG